MDILEQIRKLRPTDVYLAILLFLSSVAPGFLVIFHYKPQFFADCNIIKLLILSASLTLPLTVINAVLLQNSPTFSRVVKDSDELSEFDAIFFLGMMATLLITYGSFFVTYINHDPFSSWLSRSLAAEVVVFLWVLLDRRSTARSLMKNKTNIATQDDGETDK